MNNMTKKNHAQVRHDREDIRECHTALVNYGGHSQSGCHRLKF